MPENPYQSPTYTVPCAVCCLDKIQVLDPIAIVFDMICEDCHIEYQETLAEKAQALNPPRP